MLLFYNLTCIGVTEPFLSFDVPGEPQFTACVDSEENTSLFTTLIIIKERGIISKSLGLSSLIIKAGENALLSY